MENLFVLVTVLVFFEFWLSHKKRMKDFAKLFMPSAPYSGGKDFEKVHDELFNRVELFPENINKVAEEINKALTADDDIDDCRESWRDDLSCELGIMIEIDAEVGAWDMLAEYYTHV